MGAGPGMAFPGENLDSRARLLLTNSTIDPVAIAMFAERRSR
jgi:hypothetical protein